MSLVQHLQTRLQPLGRALMLPIAVLPVAALLLRLGQPDLLSLPFVAASGAAIFAHLGLLFAIGVGVGLAEENHGAAALAGAVCFLVLTEGAKVLVAVPGGAVPAGLAGPVHDAVVAAWKDKQLAKLGVPAGIVSGLSAGWLYNRFHAISLPPYLAFFGGRRFVPIAAGLAGLCGAAVFGLGFPLLEAGVDRLSNAVVHAGLFGLFLYGLLNRLLIITGLHHILNNLAWFVLGDYHGVSGDLNRFFAGDPTAGAFMAGFFPVMMFGLPAGCLAIYRAAHPSRRKATGGMLLSMGLTSLLTGVTEPIEFSFMFLAPQLYLLHAVLTGAAMALMAALEIRLGFGFSAGLFDYLLNFRLARHPLWLLPIGLAYSAIYYLSFSFAIRRFNLPTPGREPLADAPEPAAEGPPTSRGEGFLAALGGPDNLTGIGACTTRLRLNLADRGRVDRAALAWLGAMGTIEVGGDGLQVVVGPQAELIAGELRAAASAPGQPVIAPASAGAPAGAGDSRGPTPGAEAFPALPPVLLAALGGVANVTITARPGGRLIAALADPAALDRAALAAAAPGQAYVTGGARVHILLNPGNVAPA